MLVSMWGCHSAGCSVVRIVILPDFWGEGLCFMMDVKITCFWDQKHFVSFEKLPRGGSMDR